MKKIPYFYERDTQTIAKLLEKPKAKWHKEGELPDKPLKIEYETVNPPMFFRTKHTGVFEISWIKYLWFRLLGLTDNDILNKV